MIGARLRISDVETCNTSVFLWVYCMLEQAVSPNIQQFGGVIYFVLGKRSPVISRKILQKWLLWAKPESSAILSIV